MWLGISRKNPPGRKTQIAGKFRFQGNSASDTTALIGTHDLACINAGSDNTVFPDDLDKHGHIPLFMAW
jgi:hypothetical protein